MLSIVFPIRNEENNLLKIVNLFNKANFDFEYEILLINDFSEDDSLKLMKKISETNLHIKFYDNEKKGIGGAINLGIQKSLGEYCCIMMADLSDELEDLRNYYKIITDKKLDAVFGSRFLKKSRCIDYPLKKYVLNRIFNLFVSILFLNKYNDYTNAFKIYKKESLIKTFPLVSESFNIFLEIPLKIISRNFKYSIIPINWKNRKSGKSKFKIHELRSKYLFTLIYCFIEKILLNKSI